jgi:hypothetical protein
MVVGLILLAVFVLGLVAWRHFSTERDRLEKLLGTTIPRSASEFHVWVRQVPGTFQAELIARFRIPRADFDRLVNDMGLSQSHGIGSGWPLPTNFNTDTNVTWWHPPENQPERFSVATNGFKLTCVWNNDLVYLRKTGAFGSTWK